MKNYLMFLGYDGRNYDGFQAQSGHNTIMNEIIHALRCIDSSIEKVNAAGRTDKGVHALAQAVNFHSAKPLNLFEWRKAVNSFLPTDIHINKIKTMPLDFHARHDAVEKEYTYIIKTGRYNLFSEPYCFYHQNLDFDKMAEVAKLFIGEHDFTNYTTDSLKTKHTLVRSVNSVECLKRKGEIRVIFKSKGFLRAQVRMMVGAMIKVAIGKADIITIQNKLARVDQVKWTYKAPPGGLYLTKVSYE